MIDRSVATAVILLLACLALAGCGASSLYEQDRQAVGHFTRAQSLQAVGDLDAALAEFKKAIHVNPSLAPAHAAIGDIHRKKHELPAAVKAYEIAVQTNPHNFRNHYNCGYLHQTVAQAERALEEVQRHLNRAVELYGRARELRPNDYGTLVNLAVCHFSLGQYPQAEAYCKEAIAVDGSRPLAYTNLGAVYDAQGQAYEAVNMYRQSLERDSRQPEVLMNLAAVYVRQGKFQAALRDYETALDLLDNPAPALERLGYCYYHMGEYDKAEENYSAALEHQPDSAEAHCGLGTVYMTRYVLDKSRQELRDRALTEWRQSLEINPHQPALIELVEKYRSRPANASGL